MHINAGIVAKWGWYKRVAGGLNHASTGIVARQAVAGQTGWATACASTYAPAFVSRRRAMVELRRALHENSVCRTPLINTQHRWVGTRVRSWGA